MEPARCTLDVTGATAINYMKELAGNNLGTAKVTSVTVTGYGLPGARKRSYEVLGRESSPGALFRSVRAGITQARAGNITNRQLLGKRRHIPRERFA
ncbi:MAG: hypothetical protein OXR66_00695 [Candidatus Woesearchaeota archaeon]|nr:hypothetical protein [Candidatus Woesearchaeota archaeon]